MGVDLINFVPLSEFGDAVLLVSRVILASVMLYFGIPKISDLKQNGVNFGTMGFKPGIFWGTLIAFIEVFGGIALLAGILTGVFAALFGFQMLIGLSWKLLKTTRPFSDYSYEMVLLSQSLILLTYGPGQFAFL